MTLSSAIKEPYRIFFPLGILCAVIGIGHWIFYALGWSGTYSAMTHSSIQMQPYMGCFVAGFLMTAMPRMTGTHPATMPEVLGLAFLTLAIVILFQLQYWVAGALCWCAWLLGLLGFGAARITAKRRSASASGSARILPPAEFIWLPVSILGSLTGSVILVLGHLGHVRGPLLIAAEKLAQQGFILGVVFGIGGFLASRLTGRFRTQKKDVHESICSPQDEQAHFRKLSVRIHGAMALLFIGSFIAEGWDHIRLAYGLRAAAAGGAFLWTGVLPLWPRTRDAYAWMVWVSFWMVELGLLGVMALPPYKKAFLHVTFLGGLSLMTFAVATMVILSHAGQGEKLHRPLWYLKFAGTGVLLALAVRILAVFQADAYFRLLAVAAGIWIAAALVWLIALSGALCHAASSEDLERHHEEAKKRVLRSS